MKLFKKVLAFPSASARSDETAFLPAALEVVETPASPVGRAIAATLSVIFCSAVVWASLSEVDIVASSPGKIVALGGTKVTQPLEAGIVRAIHVRDGQQVRAGEILVELDPTINESDRNHTQADLVAVQLEIARLRASLADNTDPFDGFDPPVNATAIQVKTQRDYLMRQTVEYRAKIKAIERQLDQRQAERNTIQATVAKLSAIVPIVQQRVDIRKVSSDQEYTSKFQYLEMLQLLVEQQQELMVQRSRLLETVANIAALSESRTQAVAEFHRTLHGQLAEAERKAETLSYDLAKSEQRIKSQYLRAPLDGTVQQLAIHTIGGVVTPAQVLLAVVPLKSHLEVETMVLNRDVGFVRAKQRAEIKVDTFNFTKYGLLQGEVINISKDAVVRERSYEKNEKNLGAESASSEPRGQELSFAARISLNRTDILIDDQVVNLSPGMAVTVEIKIGSRSVLSYLMSPVARYRHEIFKER